MAAFIPLHKSFNLEVANFGKGVNNRIIIIRSAGDSADIWKRITGTNIIIVGGATRKELRRFLQQFPKSKIEQLIPGGIGSRTLTRLRANLGISKGRGRPPLP